VENNKETTPVQLSVENPAAALGYIERLLVTGKVSPDMLHWLVNIKQQLLSANEFDLDHNLVALKDYLDRTPEQEIDMMDRIISGLPVYDVGRLHPVEVKFNPPITEETWANVQKLELVDVASAHPTITWERIPNFDNYEINQLGMVRSRWTKRELDVSKDGDAEYVDMHDKDGFSHIVNVGYIKEQVFG
jgi:hypothetical protein